MAGRISCLRDQVRAARGAVAAIELEGSSFTAPGIPLSQVAMASISIRNPLLPGNPEGRAKKPDILNGEVTLLPDRDPLTREVAPLEDRQRGAAP